MNLALNKLNLHNVFIFQKFPSQKDFYLAIFQVVRRIFYYDMTTLHIAISSSPLHSHTGILVA
jgi:hypothetical protein